MIATGALEQSRLIDSLLELDGSRDEEPVYRAETPEFRAWLDRASTGSPDPDETASLDPMGRSAPLGLVHRRDPSSLVSEVIQLNRLFHSDAGSILGAVVMTSAVAASCFGQVGRDFIMGVAESVTPAVERLMADSVGLIGLDQIEDFDGPVRSLVEHYGVLSASEAVALVSPDGEPGPLELSLVGLLLAAPTADTPHEPIAEAVKVGGGNLGAAVGAIMGARVGIRAWPWPSQTTLGSPKWVGDWFEDLRRSATSLSHMRSSSISYRVCVRIIHDLFGPASDAIVHLSKQEPPSEDESNQHCHGH